MKMNAATFDDEGQLATVTVTLPLDELAVLYRFVGHVAPFTVTEASGDVRWGNAAYDLADGVAAILNRFFDGGAADVIPVFTIAEKNHGGQT